MGQIKNKVADSQAANGVKYVVELRASNASSAYPYVWSSSRVWVRGYDSIGKKIYEETVGFCNGNNRGPRSRAGKLMAVAEKLISTLQRPGDINCRLEYEKFLQSKFYYCTPDYPFMP